LGGFVFIMEDYEKYLVDCSRCGHWAFGRKIMGEVCKACHNTGKVFDPKLILCNMCAGPMRPLGTGNEQYVHGLEAEVVGSYESYHLFDMTHYKFNFCEECLRKLFDQCKIPPRIDLDFAAGSELSTYSDDKSHYDYRVWKDNGGHHQAYLNKKCNVVKECPETAVYTILMSGDFTEDCCCEEHKETHIYSNSKLTKFIPNVLKAFL
jgi:hypothetical protein